jgi:ABC-type transporter Mla MlaB component
MTLKIEPIFGEGKTRIRLSGQLRSEHLGPLKTEIARHRSRVALDLEEVERVDLDGVRFLNECESAGTSILHCLPYVREWMAQERNGPKNQSEP